MFGIHNNVMLGNATTTANIEGLSRNGQQFHQYQQNEQRPLNSIEKTTIVAGLNRLLGFQPLLIIGSPMITQITASHKNLHLLGILKIIFNAFNTKNIYFHFVVDLGVPINPQWQMINYGTLLLLKNYKKYHLCLELLKLTHFFGSYL
jgi:hypothetical protein